MANDVEQSIIEVAINLFSKKGYAATSIRDIANSIDMTSASLYYYIKNKKDLLNLVMDRYMKRLIDGAKQSLQEVEHTNPETKLKVLINHHVLSHGKEKLAALVVDTEYRSLEGKEKEAVKALRDAYEDLWLDILEEGKQQGVFNFDNIKITSYALINLCTGVAHWYQKEGPLSIQEIADEYTVLGLKMVQ